MRKCLSYTLQIGNGIYQNDDDENIALKLADLYMHFWNENMVYSDYEPYSRIDWGGISFFFVIAAMRRFNKLYKNDFNIIDVTAQKMMIVLSPKGSKKIRDYVPTDNDNLYEMALEDHIYKPVGKGSYPKAQITDAPLNRTKDGYIFANPLIILFNDSLETQFLNYLRRCDNPRYLRIKDKIKERVIPLIQEMMEYKFKSIFTISNFLVKIPNQKKAQRECDLLVIDNQGTAVYLEIKHFYNPQSFCEEKVLDKELTKALNKIPQQLEAIKNDWDKIKIQYGIPYNINEIYGVIVSHRYTGVDVEIRPDTPIINTYSIFQSIVESSHLKEVYLKCKEIDELWPKVYFVKKDMSTYFAGYHFHITLECMDPQCEIIANRLLNQQVAKNIRQGEIKYFDETKEAVRAYVDKMTMNK